MASLTFQPYVDKENAVSFRMPPGKSQTGGPVKGLGGKIFGKSNQNQPLATPRRALGDIINTGINTKIPAHKQKSALKPLGSQQKKGLQQRENNIIKSSQPKSENVAKVIQKQVKKKPDVDDIELMHISVDKEDDDFEDIWPKSERISTYINKLITWRPPCLFGQIPVSDDEVDEDEEHRQNMEDLDRILDQMPKPVPLIPDEDIPDFEDLLVPEPLEDIPMPTLDDLEALNNTDNKDISLPLLDDSLDIVSSMGHLTLKNSP